MFHTYVNKHTIPFIHVGYGNFHRAKSLVSRHSDEGGYNTADDGACGRRDY